jgi:hypothetical protein
MSYVRIQSRIRRAGTRFIVFWRCVTFVEEVAVLEGWVQEGARGVYDILDVTWFLLVCFSEM